MIVKIFTLILILLNIAVFISLTVLILLISIPNRKIKYKNNFFPTVSIVLCAKNEEKTIEKTIKSLLSLDYPKNRREIIIVSDSTDRTNEICEKYKDKIKIIKRERKEGKWSALNDGIKEAKGEIISTTDADTILSKDWLKNLIKPFQDKEISLTFGSINIKNSKYNFLTKAQNFYFSVVKTFQPVLANLKWIYISSGNNMAFRKTLWQRFKFRNHPVEDIDFSYRILKSGYKAFYTEGAEIYTKVFLNFNEMRNQQVRWFYILEFDSRTILLGLLFVFVLSSPSLMGLTSISLFYIENDLLLTGIFLNLLLGFYLYYVLCFKVKINPIDGFYWFLTNVAFVFIYLESIFRSIIKKPISWKK